MSDRKHELVVHTNTGHSIQQLKQAICDQYPSKILYFIAPPSFQQIIFHGQIIDDAKTVGQLLPSDIALHTKTQFVFPQRKHGQLVLLQKFPRSDAHLKQLHAIITDKCKVLRVTKLAKKYRISCDRVRQIIRFLEALGFVQMISSGHARTEALQSEMAQFAQNIGLETHETQSNRDNDDIDDDNDDESMDEKEAVDADEETDDDDDDDWLEMVSQSAPQLYELQRLRDAVENAENSEDSFLSQAVSVDAVNELLNASLSEDTLLALFGHLPDDNDDDGHHDTEWGKIAYFDTF